METMLITDRLATDVWPTFAWIGDFFAFFEQPIVLAMLGLVGVCGSLRLTRSARHTLAAAGIIAGSAAALVTVGRFGPLAIVILPAMTLAVIQGFYWGLARRDRLEWVWQAVPADAGMQLVAGTGISSGGLLVMWASSALGLAMLGSDGMPMNPGPADWVWALFGMTGLVVAAVMLIVGSTSMLKGFLAAVRAAVQSPAPAAQEPA